MTAPEIVAAADREGCFLSVTRDGKLHCRPKAAGALRAAIQTNVAEILAFLRDPDRHGWLMPSQEAMPEARTRRAAAGFPLAVDSDSPSDDHRSDTGTA